MKNHNNLPEHSRLMRSGVVLALLSILLSPLPSDAQTAAVTQPAALVLTRVTLIDMTGAPPKRNMTIVVQGDRITEVGKTGKIKVPTGAQVVDGVGKFLIPGLWDMHVHAWDANVFYPVLLANGITGVRDMGDDMAALAGFRRRIESGALSGPRLVFAGKIIDGLRRGGGADYVFDYAANADEARALVRERKKGGADFIKIYSYLTPDIFLQIADEARRNNLTFAGHTPLEVGAGTTSDAGMRSIEHLTGIALACSTSEAEGRAEIKRLLAEMRALDAEQAKAEGETKGELTRKVFALANRAREVADDMTTYDSRKAASLFARFRRNKTWQVPTLAVGGNPTRDDLSRLDDERLKYFPSFVRGIIRSPNAPTTAGLVRDRKRIETSLRVVGEMHRAGVSLLAGSDSPNPNSYPGFSLHDELEFLVRAGLTPMEALRTATRNPAEFLGLLGSAGTIQIDRRADLLLLDADPLADIRHTRRINAVVARGRLLDRATLDRMLTEAETKANKPVAAKS